MTGNVTEEDTELELEESDDVREVAVPKYSPGVSLYGFLHRYARSYTAVFGSIAAFGLLVLVRQFYTFIFGPAEWAGLPPWCVFVGVFLFGFGVSYYAVRDETACSECGTPFAKERVSKRPVKQEDSDSDGVYIRETLECQSCANQTTNVYRQPERDPPQF